MSGFVTLISKSLNFTKPFEIENLMLNKNIFFYVKLHCFNKRFLIKYKLFLSAVEKINNIKAENEFK